MRGRSRKIFGSLKAAISRCALCWLAKQDNPNHREEHTMKASTKDKAQGTLHQVKGTVKEVTGKIVENPEWEVKGKIEKSKGKLQEQVGKTEKVLGK
jgi:uncharacterized protein YjbJ (UPF0337 family)